MSAYTLSVDSDALNLDAYASKAVFLLRRASVADSFVIVPEFKRTIQIGGYQFNLKLLPNTAGSVYEVILYSLNNEMLRAFFIMPASDVFLHELNLLTAYPEMNPVFATFLQLNDTPNSYSGHAGKIVAVTQDETGLEFIDCNCGDNPDLVCVPSSPITFSLDKTLYEANPLLQYRLYAMTDGEIESRGIDLEGEDSNTYLSLGAISNSFGLHFAVGNEDNLYPEFCNEFGYEMECYLFQYVEVWNSGATVGAAKVYLNDEEYLESEVGLGLDHSFEFEDQSQLKGALRDYYIGIAEWMQTLGLDASYDPDMWGSYNSGGVKINVTQAQKINFNVNSADGYALALGIQKSTPKCINLIPFDDLPNPPNTLIISPRSGSEPSEKMVTTLLANYVPPEGEVNVLSLLGITEDISMTSCSYEPE